MRADRLLSLMLLLRSRGRMSATALAAELEVSVRTVLRDVEALSTAGVPVYAERGRHGGFALLPGFTTDLTGLTPDEALALATAGSRATAEALGLATDLASAMRKVLASMPDARRLDAAKAAERVVVRRGGWLRNAAPEAGGPSGVVREAVFGGRRLRIRYTARDGVASWRTVDPVGLVQADGHWYLLATRDGADRTYRLSRIDEAIGLDEPADRPSEVDLNRLWEQRRSRFTATLTWLPVTARVLARRRGDLVRTALRLIDERAEDGGWIRLELAYGDRAHAVGALWSLGADAVVLAPEDVRAAIVRRADDLLSSYRPG